MTTEANAVADLAPHAVPAGTIARALVPFATLPDGGLATFPLIVIAGVRPGPTAAVIGGVHGDEYEGPAALLSLPDAVAPQALAGRLLIVPVANLAAFASGTRTSPVDQQNLARIFPGDPSGTLSYRLAHALFTRVVATADFVVDCHSGGVRLAFLDVAGFYGPDDHVSAALSKRSLELAKDLGLSRLWRLPARAGVLSYEAMRRGIPATGAEIGGRGGCLEADWRAYAMGIRHILARHGMIEENTPTPGRNYNTCLVGDWALAPVGGWIDNHVALGATVEAGALLATLRSPLGRVITEMRASQRSIIMGIRHLPSISAGEWATCSLEERPL
jgi:predicted deacylase